MSYSISPIGIIKTGFIEKFGIPRQPSLAPSVRGVLELYEPYNHPDWVRGLDGISHLWVLFIFHQHIDRDQKALVRPPRAGGNEKFGVFATRSSFRPNNLGMSVVKLESVQREGASVSLILSGIDIVDGTPVVDIKPYVPYADVIPQAQNNFANGAPELLPVKFSVNALKVCAQIGELGGTDFKQQIVEVLQQDPRPAYQTFDENREYGMAFYQTNIRWRYILIENIWWLEVVGIDIE